MVAQRRSRADENGKNGHALPVLSLVTSGVVARELPFAISVSRRQNFAGYDHS
jgi:hypothetical protein